MELEKKIKVIKLSGVSQLVLSENKISNTNIDYIGSYNNLTNEGNDEISRVLDEISKVLEGKTVKGTFNIEGNNLVFRMPNISVRKGFVVDNPALSDENIHYTPANNDYTTKIVISDFDQIINGYKASELYGMDASSQRKLVSLIMTANNDIQRRVKPEKARVNRVNKYDKLKTTIAVTAGAAVILGGFVLAGHYDQEELENRSEIAKSYEPTTSTYDSNLLRDDYESKEMKEAVLAGESYNLEYDDNIGGHLRR